ncbi:tetratricopeptide repeat protein [Nocardia wallacei]|uniref:tetratricopeptide repeat protein n=1 Tax=Nocardia wallacei TaxID=480035 RepID=UPI002457E3C4|nr:tetratricopeptide repeat protein [Nocardia wallacei]
MTVGRDFITTYRFSGTAPAATEAPLVELVERRGADGGLPLITELDPYLLGATPSRFGEPGRFGRADPYVPRTHNAVDIRLAAALQGGRLTVVVGPSKAGKTRSLFEAVSTVLPTARVLVPTPESLARIPACTEFTACPEPIVVWLDNLDRFLTTSRPLTPLTLSRLTARPAPTVVVATLRCEVRDRLHYGSEDLAHDTRVVLQQAIQIDLSSTSNSLVEHADAAAAYPSLNLDRHGLAEVLAGAPELLQHYDASRYRNPVLHTVIQVAVDWVRVGRTDPIPEPVLAELALTIVEDQHPELEVGADQVQAAIVAARTPFPGVGHVALLRTDRLPDRSRGYRPFDYLVAADDGQHRSPRPIATDFWHLATEDADVDVLVSAGLNAFFRGRASVVEKLCRRAADAGDLNAMFNLGVLLYARGDTDEAETWCRRAAEAGDRSAMFNLGVLLHERGDTNGAENWWRRCADAGDLNAMSNLGVLLRKRGAAQEAEAWYRRAAAAGDLSAMFNLGVLLGKRDELAEAEAWYRRAAAGGHASAEFNLQVLLDKKAPAAPAGHADDATQHPAARPRGTLSRPAAWAWVEYRAARRTPPPRPGGDNPTSTNDRG